MLLPSFGYRPTATPCCVRVRGHTNLAFHVQIAGLDREGCLARPVDRHNSSKCFALWSGFPAEVRSDHSIDNVLVPVNTGEEECWTCGRSSDGMPCR